MRNLFPMFAVVPDLYRKENVHFLVVNPDKNNGGYKMYKLNDLKDRYALAEDWFFELDDLYISALNDYGVKKNSWKKAK